MGFSIDEIREVAARQRKAREVRAVHSIAQGVDDEQGEADTAG